MIRIRSIARAAAMGGLLLLAPAAEAEVPANGKAYLDAAFASVQSLLRLYDGKPTLPRLSDPVDGKVLADVWNLPAILGTPPYAAPDLALLLEFIQKQTQILQVYALFSPEPGRKEPDQAANAVEFQDELSHARVFLLRAAGGALSAINDFSFRLKDDEKTEERARGLREMRLGLQEIVVGSALALRDPGLTDANRLLIAGAFAENAAGIAAALAPPDRNALVGALQAVRPSLRPEAQKAISDFATAVASAPCEGFCLVN
ncbi:hypothetical protein [Bosea sp. (in: a-proteobacteria)]|uniref:hypothetical protein n=1 Tax=Bosea sp. (in: a-proteobacteria) TaxID=1871050 RepID=UPI0026371AB0|nr:hypothetical protein [Bosea sp. (in: a-proteobacteria)]MCO5092601.1 hypothetical protein [Bosea sp. (in: a-proteobacteria)]